ncbi:hypothetical protein ANCDUO_09658, partial [Ancylostoma duodenale]
MKAHQHPDFDEFVIATRCNPFSERVDEKGEWSVEKNLAGHSDYVRDVAWCPVISHSVYTIASCGM